MSKPIIEVENLGKRYRIGATREPYLSLREELTKKTRRISSAFTRILSNSQMKPSYNETDFWALNNVSFPVQEGEAIGIIGRNGAGKSTLLKVLSQITPPTKGKITMRGRVASLLEVGTGFHPELTGRENIFLNGAILGMRREEIRRKFDEIVAFAEVEKFLDTPVKRYSSGMYVRLAFAVAAHLEPEILIVDEVLSVGDAQFQKKCLRKMEKVAKQGRTVLFVSHIMAAIRSLTQKSIFLDRGEMVFFGSTSTAIDQYLNSSPVQTLDDKVPDLNYYRRQLVPHSPVKFRKIWMTGAKDQCFPSFVMGEDFEINCELECSKHFNNSTISFWLTNQMGEKVLTGFSMDQDVSIPLEPGRPRISCRVHGLPLSPGRYNISIGVNETPNTIAFDVLIDFPIFEVVLPELSSGELAWSHRPWGAVHWTNNTWNVIQNSKL
jgi:lipopolysaccharide transport system ATP-binding protein